MSPPVESGIPSQKSGHHSKRRVRLATETMDEDYCPILVLIPDRKRRRIQGVPPHHEFKAPTIISSSRTASDLPANAFCCRLRFATLVSRNQPATGMLNKSFRNCFAAFQS